MVSPTSQQTRVLDWLRDHLPKDESIQLADITSMYTVVNVIGPKAGALISELSQSDININIVQPFTYKVSYSFIIQTIISNRYYNCFFFIPDCKHWLCFRRHDDGFHPYR